MSFTPSDAGPDAALVRRVAERFGPAEAVSPVAPDASTRLFFRLELPGGERRIAMVDPVGGPAAVNRMVAAHRLLADIGVRTARVFDRDDELPALLLEDLGDLLLADALPQLGREDRRRLYAEAGSFAGLISREGTARVGRDHPLAFPALDRRKLRTELALFVVHDVAGRRGSSDQSLLQALSELADKICDVVGGAPPRLAHRDFHARNLLVLAGPRLAAVDCQDALLAPPLYDLASLARDPYVEPEAELTAAAAGAFADASGARGDPLLDSLYPWVSLQRVLKAIGTYAFQARVKRRDRFLSYIPAAERQALAAADALPEPWRSPAHTLLLHIGMTA